ncbi:hypothetical protein ACKWTF_004705 [Chironomus riparius]
MNLILVLFAAAIASASTQSYPGPIFRRDSTDLNHLSPYDISSSSTRRVLPFQNDYEADLARKLLLESISQMDITPNLARRIIAKSLSQNDVNPIFKETLNRRGQISQNNINPSLLRRFLAQRDEVSISARRGQGLTQRDLELGLARRLLAQSFGQHDITPLLARRRMGQGISQSDLEHGLTRRLLAKHLLVLSEKDLSQSLARRSMGLEVNQNDLELGLARRLLAKNLLAQSDRDLGIERRQM